MLGVPEDHWINIDARHDVSVEKYLASEKIVTMPKKEVLGLKGGRKFFGYHMKRLGPSEWLLVEIILCNS